MELDAKNQGQNIFSSELYWLSESSMIRIVDKQQPAVSFACGGTKSNLFKPQPQVSMPQHSLKGQ